MPPLPDTSFDPLLDGAPTGRPSANRMGHANRERGKPPLRYRLRRASRRSPGPKRLAAILALLAVPALAFCGFSLWRGAQRAQQDVERMRASADTLQRQATAFDLAGAAATMTQLRHEADDARDTTSGPLWATATILPVLGDDVAAARNVSSSVAGILDAAQPLEQSLPKLQRTKGQIDVDALANIAGAMPPSPPPSPRRTRTSRSSTPPASPRSWPTVSAP